VARTFEQQLDDDAARVQLSISCEIDDAYAASAYLLLDLVTILEQVARFEPAPRARRRIR
jgi:hypothetical protein